MSLMINFIVEMKYLIKYQVKYKILFSEI